MMLVLIALLAGFSAAGAAGMRIALPLLMLGLFYNDRLWSDLPLLWAVHPQVLIAVLTSWSIFELLGSKKLLGQRMLQQVQLLLSIPCGAIMTTTVIKLSYQSIEPLWLVGMIGGLFALVLQLVQIGWFFRLRGIPIWGVILEDILCVILVLFAFHAPTNGGLIAMLLLWVSIRSAGAWKRWSQKTGQQIQPD